MSGGSFNSNFNQHRKEWSVTMRNNDSGGGSAHTGGFDGKTGNQPREYAAERGGFGSDSMGKGMGGGKGYGKGGKGGNGGKGEAPTGRQLSSDDRIFDQFKKRARR